MAVWQGLAKRLFKCEALMLNITGILRLFKPNINAAFHLPDKNYT
jgi:hypothetical protein